MTEPRGMFSHSDYTVGWICALPESELVAAMAMLDEKHPVLPAIDPHDSNSYVLGTIGDHNVVIACLPAETTGKVSAATVAKDMIRSFPAVRFGLMVGVGGGVPYFNAGGSDHRTEAKEGGDSEDSDESDDDPADTRDIRLGDVAISLHSKSSDAVVQYDFGKSLQEKRFILSGGKLNKPPSILLGAVALLQAQHRMEGHQILKTLSNIMSTYPALATKFQHPGPQKDYLFKAEFIHETGKKTCKRCRSQDSNLVKRDYRSDNSPRLHYGTIGSADQVMKDALLRDKWAREEGIICFEMEAAGLMDSFPCLVIRGICDYADSHKNKIWQPYAAATAACYAKELLHVISGQGVMIMDPIKQIKKSVREVYSIVKDTSAAVQDLSMRSRQRKVLDKLPYVEGSSFDASDAEHEARCHPETRIDLLNQILEWADNQRGECIFWLNGMAGTGKSTISRTIAQRFWKKKQLGASFFFKRGEGQRASAKRLFTTICAQLLLQDPTLIRYVELTIDKDPYISGKSLKEQFTKLLLEPILSLDGGECTNVVILIDALDECDNKDDIRTVLQLLPDVQKCKSRNIRVFITSRPELPIRPVFEQTNNYRCLALHNLSETVVGEDIRIFINDEFSLIKERRKILGQWPGDDVLETLVRRAVPLFISAFTMCRFVDDSNWLPEDRLLMLLENPAATSGSLMDRTYLPVLQQLLSGAIDHEKKQLEQEFQDTVGVIILLASPLSVRALAQLTGIRERIIATRLQRFHSVLRIPANPEEPVRILHLSFRDYLVTTTEKSFFVDEQETHMKIASNCFRIMETHLQRNICGLTSYGTGFKDIDPQAISHHLTDDLKYSCRYWVYHVLASDTLDDFEVLSFLQKHLLHWLEALSLMRNTPEALRLIRDLQSEVLVGLRHDLVGFLQHAEKFVLSVIHIADIAPLQIYCSGLQFLPSANVIRQCFRHEIYDQIQIQSEIEEASSLTLQTLNLTDHVNSAIFSHDSELLAAALKDDTIQVWNSNRGEHLKLLIGHQDSVQSIAFCKDSRFLASCSQDHTIRVWDIETGENIITCKEHINAIYNIAFSSDFQLLASGSADRSIKIWSTCDWKCQRTLEGHKGSVLSVAFSGNSFWLASASRDREVRIWETCNWNCVKTLKHGGEVTSVTFSHDSSWLASASVDRKIKIWDTSNWECLATLGEHRERVTSVNFSHDATRLASASGDQFVIIWNTSTWQCSRKFRGHGGWVESVVFSHDSKRLASASLDHTVRVWDATHASIEQISENHDSYVEAVTFPTHEKLIASASGDSTIKIWDASNGALLRTLEGHKDPVLSVDFSHDFTLLASGSADCAVKIWDTSTGKCLCMLENYHGHSVVAVSFSHDSQMLASASLDQTINILKRAGDKNVKRLGNHERGVCAIAFSPNSEYFSSASADGSVIIWRTSDWTLLHRLEDHKALVSSLTFSHDSIFLASADEKGTVIVWDATKGEQHHIRKMEKETRLGILDMQTSCLRTTRGVIDLSLCSGDEQCTRFELREGGLSPDRQWVTWNSENKLWLPPEYRPSAWRGNACAISESKMVLGSDSGQVLLLAFTSEDHSML
ncbi:putative G-protein beta WD-40 repeats-containing protein [Aspergillus uvarum CBS 121591]|uniref:Putative G-protein beta WD-40 repeats-containing protein n=1 Tax=Aspergillus uvarum CBS 121591 TaxID=1448315 RepID=A0A319CL67_9EURO|nr:putative G-protein beta WD-40 repeats-containing protein [Aspergillus uvarum CBS 121591]PYH76158.1 putative G-protein beta WD-40 repeats-containing protein [Aspergillus uvarum CBS 121591]